MPTLQSVTLTDRATTPVVHTFTPRGREGADGGRTVEVGVSAVADRLFTIEPRRTPGGRFKVDLRLIIPVVQTKIESGVTSYVISRTNRATMTFDLAHDSTEQERKDIVGMMMSALDPSKVLVNDVLVKGEAVW